MGLRLWPWRSDDPLLAATVGPSAVLFRADGSYEILPHRLRRLGTLQKFVGTRVIVIDVCGTVPTKATVLMIDRDSVRERKPVNRCGTILFQGVPRQNNGAVRGDVIVTLLQDPRGLVIPKARRAEDWVTGELAQLCAPESV